MTAGSPLGRMRCSDCVRFRADDVLELFALVPAESPRPELGATAQAVLEILGERPLSADQNARAAGLESAPLTSLDGEIGRRNGSWRLPVGRFCSLVGSWAADGNACPKPLASRDRANLREPAFDRAAGVSFCGHERRFTPLEVLRLAPKAGVGHCFVEAVTPIRLPVLVKELGHLLD
jgi:hypothetical protein